MRGLGRNQGDTVAKIWFELGSVYWYCFIDREGVFRCKWLQVRKNRWNETVVVSDLREEPLFDLNGESRFRPNQDVFENKEDAVEAYRRARRREVDELRAKMLDAELSLSTSLQEPHHSEIEPLDGALVRKAYEDSVKEQARKELERQKAEFHRRYGESPA